MKTQIIQLGQNEDAVSLRDRMSWCQTQRILLVWPTQGRGLARRLDLTLLKRYAESLGSELAIVTQDASARFAAQQTGIPVFSTVSQANQQEWRMTRTPPIDRRPSARLDELGQQRLSVRPQAPVWVKRPAIRYACLALCVLSVLALAIVILPGATVVLSPRQQSQSMQVSLTSDPAALGIDNSTLTLPAYLQTIVVEGSQVISTTGSLSIPYEHALGSLEFTNSSATEITVPSGTLVSTQGTQPSQFITRSAADVVLAPGESILVDARALNPGSAGNLPVDSLVVLQSGLGSGLSVTNPSPMQGGTDASLPSPGVLDQQSLHQRLTTLLAQQALVDLHALLPNGDLVVTPTLSFTQVIDEKFSPSIGEPGEQLELYLKLKAQAQVISSESINRLLTPMLDRSLPAGYLPVKESITLQPLNPPFVSPDGKAHWTVVATRQVRAVIPPQFVVEFVRGVRTTRALEQLSTLLPLSGQAQVSMLPKGWPWFPILAMRINVVQEAQP